MRIRVLTEIWEPTIDNSEIREFVIEHDLDRSLLLEKLSEPPGIEPGTNYAAGRAQYLLNHSDTVSGVCDCRPSWWLKYFISTLPNLDFWWQHHSHDITRVSGQGVWCCFGCKRSKVRFSPNPLFCSGCFAIFFFSLVCAEKRIQQKNIQSATCRDRTNDLPLTKRMLFFCFLCIRYLPEYIHMSDEWIILCWVGKQGPWSSVARRWLLHL